MGEHHLRGKPDARPARAELSWVVTSTHAHRELYAIANLERQGFACYCPMLRRTVRHARRVQEAARPLFPGYVFVGVEADMRRWRPLLSTYGVRSVLGSNGRPDLLDADFIASLRAREVDGVIVRPASPFAVGQRVRVASGALDGLVATVIELDERDRLVVLLDLLKRQVRVHLDPREVNVVALA